MARIRAIKPEFWSSPNLPADPWTRLLYIAMWNWADDMGVGTANPRELLGFAFPNDDDITPGEIRRMLGGIRRVFGVDFYEVAGRPYYAIPNWSKHQKFDNRAKGKYPGVDQAESWLYQDITDDTAEPAVIPSRSRRDAVAGTGEQGKRGTGEIGTGEERNRPSPAVLASEFDRAWSSWPKKVEKQPAFEKFKTKCRKRVPSELADDIVRFGEAYAATTDKQFVPGLAVWLNKERWTDELPQARAFDRGLTRTEENMQAVLEMRAREQAQEQPMWGELE